MKKFKVLKKEVKKLWSSRDKSGDPCVNVHHLPLGVGGRNIVLEGPRDGDMRDGIHRLVAEKCPALMERRNCSSKVARIEIPPCDPDSPPCYVYMIYARERWEDGTNLQHLLSGLKAVRTDLKKLGERDISTVRPSPLLEDKWMEYLENVFQGSGIQVNVFRDVSKGNEISVRGPDVNL